MFYNALARKKKLGDTDEAEMTSVVALHNNMNEKTWQRVVEWERVVTKEQAPPKLLKFMGRPTDLSPKAVLKHYMLGHPLPYDRHDWTVLRPDGTTVRYVIDYYYDESRAREDASSSMPSLNDTGATPSLLVDVRRALDSPREAWHRIVTMPLAQQQPQGTSYQYLPLAPTNAMKPQVQESVAVWANIQAAASGEGASEETTAAAAQPLTPAQARVLVHDFGTAVKACRKQQVKLDKCQNEWECQATSIDYTLCLSQRLCPLQHTAFRKTLKADDSGIDSALQIVHDCVLHKTAEHEQTKKDFGL
jgi:cytochrome c heme-lyase